MGSHRVRQLRKAFLERDERRSLSALFIGDRTSTGPFSGALDGSLANITVKDVLGKFSRDEHHRAGK